MALQILTSDMASPAALLARRLVSRWRIENTFKYLEDHHGIHWLCDYEMELSPDTTLIQNPKRSAARAALKEEEVAVATLERAISAPATSPGSDIAETNHGLACLQDELATRRIERDEAKKALKPMVCRLLAYNAELDLARHLNTYLEDDDEYRAITRNLLHQPAAITYTKTTITVTLRRLIRRVSPGPSASYATS